MYSIERINNLWQHFTPDDWYPQADGAGADNLLYIPVMLVFYGAVDVGIYGIGHSITKGKAKKIERSGLRSGNFRDCRLNMESGEGEY